jgi:hypothetical protein
MCQVEPVHGVEDLAADSLREEALRGAVAERDQRRVLARQLLVDPRIRGRPRRTRQPARTGERGVHSRVVEVRDVDVVACAEPCAVEQGIEKC